MRDEENAGAKQLTRDQKFAPVDGRPFQDHARHSDTVTVVDRRLPYEPSRRPWAASYGVVSIMMTFRQLLPGPCDLAIRQRHGVESRPVPWSKVSCMEI